MPAVAITAAGINLFATRKAKREEISMPAYAAIATACHVYVVFTLIKLAEVWLKSG